MSVQSVVFNSKDYDEEGCIMWLNHHNLKPLKKVHIVGDQLRYRILKPQFKHYFTKILQDDRVHLIIGYD
jgi:hypothetical protein